MTTTGHSDNDATPNPGEVDMMASVLEGRHGVYAEHVAQFFSDWNATEGLRSGQLEPVLPEYSIAALPLHAVYPETHWMSLRARTFLDLLIKHADRFTPEPVR